MKPLQRNASDVFRKIRLHHAAEMRPCVRASEADASVRPTMRPSLEYLDVRKPVSQIFQDFFQSLQINYDFFQEFW